MLQQEARAPQTRSRNQQAGSQPDQPRWKVKSAARIQATVGSAWSILTADNASDLLTSKQYQNNLQNLNWTSSTTEADVGITVSKGHFQAFSLIYAEQWNCYQSKSILCCACRRKVNWEQGSASFWNHKSKNHKRMNCWLCLPLERTRPAMTQRSLTHQKECCCFQLSLLLDISRSRWGTSGRNSHSRVQKLIGKASVCGCDQN